MTHFGTAPTVLRMRRATFPEVPNELGGNFDVIMTAGEVIDEPTSR